MSMKGIFSEDCYKYSTQCTVADVPPKDILWIKFSVELLLVSSSSCLQAISLLFWKILTSELFPLLQICMNALYHAASDYFPNTDA